MTTSDVRKKLAAERRMHNVTIANLTAIEAELAAAKDEIAALRRDIDNCVSHNAELHAEIAALRDKPCPHVRTGRGGTSYCELARTAAPGEEKP